MTISTNPKYYIGGSGNVVSDISALTATATGAMTARTAADHFADAISVKDFGAISDGTSAGGGTDNNAAFTAALAYANALYVSTGNTQYLSLAGGSYAIAGTVTWLSGVTLVGPGMVVRLGASTATGSMSSLIKGSSLNDIGFIGVTAYGVGPDRKIAGSCTDGSPVGSRDAFIDLDTISNLLVERCSMFRFMNALIVSRPTYYRVCNNYINSLSSKTLAQLDAGTFTDYTFGTSPGSGIDIEGTRSGANYTNADYGVIADNIVICVGLDIAINLTSQSGYPIRCQVTGNVTAGTNSGIQTYCSGVAVPDPGTLTTTDRGCNISGNTVVLTRQQGIYIRGVEGVSCTGNTVSRCATIGTYTGASAGGICARSSTLPTFPTSPVHRDLPNLISHNHVIDCGNVSTGVLDAGIRVDALHFLCEGNTIFRSVDRFGANLNAVGSNGLVALSTSSGDQPLAGVFRGNHIRGFYQCFTISYSGNAFSAQGGGMSMVVDSNHFASCVYGAQINFKASGVHVINNYVTECSTIGLYIKATPFSRLCRNFIEGAPIGIQLASGSMASDFYGLGAAGRQGQTLIIDDNIINGATTNPISIVETATGDASVRARCISCARNIIDGAQEFRDSVSFTATAAPTASDYHNWNVGDKIPHRNPTTATASGWICSVAGSFGPAITATGSTTSGSATLTFSALPPTPVGCFVAIAGVTGVKKILAINSSTFVATMDSTASATVSGAAVTFSAPTFLTLPNYV